MNVCCLISSDVADEKSGAGSGGVVGMGCGFVAAGGGRRRRGVSLGRTFDKLGGGLVLADVEGVGDDDILNALALVDGRFLSLSYTLRGVDVDGDSRFVSNDLDYKFLRFVCWDQFLIGASAPS